MNRSCFYLNDLHALREKPSGASRDGTRRARNAPGGFAWMHHLTRTTAYSDECYNRVGISAIFLD